MRKIITIVAVTALALVTVGAAPTAPADFCGRHPDHWKCATPTPTPTASPTPTPTATPTPTPSPTASPTPTPTPSPTATPTASPTPTSPACSTSLQTILDNAPAGATLDLTGCSFTGSWIITKPVTIIGGTFSAPSGSRVFTTRADNITFDGVDIGPGKDGIWAESPTNLVVVNSHIHDVVYSGIMFLSAVGGRAENNLIERVGVGQPNGTNAYGIGVSNYTGNQSSQDVVVRGNTVTDVPTWHAYDTHGGKRILFERNIALRASRAFFITTDSAGLKATNTIVRYNLAGDPSPVTYNLTAITAYATIDCEFYGNVISSGYVFSSGTGVYDYAGQSTGLVVYGNTVGETLP